MFATIDIKKKKKISWRDLWTRSTV